jgi:hypothetical protein
MRNSRLISLLSVFSTEEIRYLGRFIRSPYYNTGKKYIEGFFSELSKYHPKYKVSEEKLFGNVYPGKQYNDVVMRKLLSETLHLTLEFLSVEKLKDNQLKNKVILLRELSDRKAEPLFDSLLKNIKSFLDEEERVKAVRHDIRYDLADVMKFHYSFRDRSRALKYYDMEIESFTAHVIETFLSEYIERLTEKKNFSDINFSMPFFSEVIAVTEKEKYMQYPMIDIYFNHLMMLKDSSWKYYKRLKKLKEIHLAILSTNELKNIYVGLLNFVVEKSEVNDMEGIEPREELFTLYNEILERNLIEQFFSEFLFINIVTISLQLRKTEFAESFINEYSGLLNPDLKQEAVSYCRANINYYKKDYGEALSILSRISFRYYQHKLLVKNLTVKIYFEQGIETAFEYQVNAYRNFLKREKVIPSHLKNVIERFIHYTVKLMSLKEPGENYNKLEIEIKSSPVTEKYWLLEKLAEIKESHSKK